MLQELLNVVGCHAMVNSQRFQEGCIVSAPAMMVNVCSILRAVAVMLRLHLRIQDMSRNR